MNKIFISLLLSLFATGCAGATMNTAPGPGYIGPVKDPKATIPFTAQQKQSAVNACSTVFKKSMDAEPESIDEDGVIFWECKEK